LLTFNRDKGTPENQPLKEKHSVSMFEGYSERTPTQSIVNINTNFAYKNEDRIKRLDEEGEKIKRQFL
jgi:hypothetical protein